MTAIQELDIGRALPPRDVIFTFTFETWSDAVRRDMHRPPDRIVETLLRHPSVDGLLVANPFRSLPIRLARRMGGAADEAFPGGDRRAVTTPYRLTRQDSGRERNLARHYRLYDRHLRRAAARLGLTAPVVVANNPIVAAFAPFEWAGPVTYCARDDFAVHPGYRYWWPAVELAYERMRQRGIRVAAVSEPLLRRIAPTGPSAVIPNGVDGEEFLVDAKPPSWFTAFGGPVVLYAGTIDDRIDISLVGACAAALPQVTFVFVGQIDDPSHLAPLSVHRNVLVRSSVPRGELIAALRAAACCIVPHRRTALTEAMSPLKLYEYLAAGKPVVAVDLEPMRRISPHVTLTNDRPAFVNAVRSAIAAGPMGERERRQFIAEHDWTQRHDRLLALAFG